MPLKNILKVIIIILFAGIGNVYSQSRDELINRGINYIYNLKFDSSETVFRTLINNDRSDPTGYFFIAMQEWWKLNINREDESNDSKYLDAVTRTVEICDERLEKNENDAWALFLKGGVLGYRGFMWSMRESWIKAADDARVGLALIEESIDKNPGNKDAVFGIGLYNYGVDYVFESNPLLKTLLFFFKKGDKQLGLSQIKDCADNGFYSKTEANFVLAYINLVYEKNFQESLIYSEKLFNMYPDNPIFHKYVGRSLVGQSRWTESLNIWNQIMQKSENGVIGYNNRAMKREAHYYLGLSQQRVGSNDEAVVNYTKALELSREIDKGSDSQYKVYATLGIGIAYMQKGDRNEAVNWFRKVLELKEYEGSRNSAQNYIDNLSR
jgi:tetratricopeptide (TPR) repeat protein